MIRLRCSRVRVSAIRTLSRIGHNSVPPIVGQRAAGTGLGPSLPRSLNAVIVFSCIAIFIVAIWLRIGIAVRQIHYLDDGVEQRLRELLELLACSEVRQNGRNDRTSRFDEPKMVAPADYCHLSAPRHTGGHPNTIRRFPEARLQQR